LFGGLVVWVACMLVCRCIASVETLAIEGDWPLRAASLPPQIPSDKLASFSFEWEWMW